MPRPYEAKLKPEDISDWRSGQKKPDYERRFVSAAEAPKVDLPKFSCPIAQFVYQQGAA